MLALRVGLLLAVLSAVSFAEPATCLSSNPAVWPAASKPYALIIADTSGSMQGATQGPVTSSCGTGSDKRAHLRCALQNFLRTTGGRIDFGLMTFPRKQTNCLSSCFTNCTYADYPGNQTNPGCGPGSGATRRGGFIQVPVLQQAFTPPPLPDNTSTLISWGDSDCSSNTELFADGFSPVNGALLDARRYFSSSWTAQDNSVTYASPLGANDAACRSVNVILIMDGDETCDTTSNAVAAATALYATGVTVGGKTFKVRVWVMNVGGAFLLQADQIAAAGGTGTAFVVNTDTELTTALMNVATSITPAETCDNVDNDCNGCTDEGFNHLGDVQPLAANCCSAARAACLTNYRASITAVNPRGNLALLPCVTSVQAKDPATWLCFDPMERCDGVDNNVNGQIDEGTLKCGSPLHCPVAETCNGQDDDCDSVIDNGACVGGCTWRPETCDGCDNDCDGVADNGVAAEPCGLTSPPSCVGTRTCKSTSAVGAPGACSATGGWNACNNAPQAETCDGIDNDCDGTIDDATNAVSMSCVPAGTSSTLVYGAPSRCRRGSVLCDTNCPGFVGPVAEVCNGLDDDCDGTTDDGASDDQGHVAGAVCCRSGARCGTGVCTSGVWTCGPDALLCAGGVAATVETCNALDDDCNGVIDDVTGAGGECVVAGGPGRSVCQPDAGAFACVSQAICGATGGGGGSVGGGGGTATGGGTGTGGAEGTGGGTATGGGEGTGGGAPTGGGGEGTGGGTPTGGGDGTTAPTGCGCTETSAAPFGFALLALLAMTRRRANRVTTRTTRLSAIAATLITLSACVAEKPVDPELVAKAQALSCIDAGCGDLEVDPDNCGACGQQCNLTSAIAGCANGACNIARCTAGFADVDGLSANGCEAACTGDGGVEQCDLADNDCNGLTDEGFDLTQDPRHCGACNNDCAAADQNAVFTCTNSTCTRVGCAAGFAPGTRCTACTPTGAEVCNGLDDDCDGSIDEGVIVPTPVEVCGVAPSATSPECTAQVAVACVTGAWRCTFPTGVCTGATCAVTPEICDAVDNDCNGQTNENVIGFGQPCASDDGNPGSQGPCRTVGTRVCNGSSTTQCSAVKANCATLGSCTETCDGIDNDCDGLTDEGFNNKGPAATTFVKPTVTKLNAVLWVDSYELSRVSAGSTTQGEGNGYFTSASAGRTLDRTPACSVPSRLPWTNVSAAEAEQVCTSRGGVLCSRANFQLACTPNAACTYGYNPRGAAGTACATGFSAAKYCNLAQALDFDSAIAGAQQGLLATASPRLLNCWADWSGLQGNQAATDKIYDLTGNAAELVKEGTGYRVMGGSYLQWSEQGSACGNTNFTVDANFRAADVGFRCCFTADPGL